MANGYSQKHGINYIEVFTLVARMNIIILIITIVAHQRWEIYQLDVKYDFSRETLSEDVYVVQLKEYEKKEGEHMVYMV